LTGSTGDGYKFAKSFGHNIVTPKPSLVALKGSSSLCQSLAGLSLKNVNLKFTDKSDNTLYSEFGEMLFTHSGVSGPVVLSASAKLNFSDGPVTLSIDLKPALSDSELDKRILSDFSMFNNKDFANALNDLLPKKIIPVVINMSGINPRVKVNSITKVQRKKLVEVIKNFTLVLNAKADFDEAIITSGGVATNEIDPKSMQSLKQQGLYFAGEVIDVDANTGGYNLQIAFSTGYLAGKSCAEE
jgi:predicted Rossmann fold flavoprotein